MLLGEEGTTINLNYVGSLAQMRMKFRSTTDVVVNNTNELFNAQSIYIPKKFAGANITDWDDALLSPDKPAVFVAVVDNYAKIMRGDLLAQWQPIFRQDTNSSVILYLIVFDDEVADGWEIQARMISYAPLTAAFNALFPFSYFKHLFDPTYDGADVRVPVSAGTPSMMEVRLLNVTRAGTYARQDVSFRNTYTGPGTAGSAGKFTLTLDNSSGDSITLGSGTHQFLNTNGLRYACTLTAPLVIAGGTSESLDFTATTVGVDPEWSDLQTNVTTWVGIYAGFAGLDFNTVTSLVIGVNPIPGGDVVLEAGTYSYHDGSVLWHIKVDRNYTLPANGAPFVIPNVRAATVGYTSHLQEDRDITADIYNITPAPGIEITSTNIYNGSAPGPGEDITIDANSSYGYTDGTGFTYALDIQDEFTLRADSMTTRIKMYATQNGYNHGLASGLIDAGNNQFMLDQRRFLAPLPAGLAVLYANSEQGTDPVTTSYEAPSEYFDLSLALAYLCKNNIALSWLWSLVKISYDGKDPNIQDKCYIRYASRADQIAALTYSGTGTEVAPSLLNIDRSKYYWAALYLMECQNTSVIVHSEFDNIIVDILAAWFATKNESGTFIGNKLSLLRLSGTRIKPLGWKSWLDSSVNENDAEGHEQLRDMNVGHLATIADNTPQESYLTMARGVGDPDKGIPVTMQMIAKFVDYTCSMEAAKMITSTGTLANPVLTDEAAYSSIQDIVKRTLGKFSGTNGRVTGVVMSFPDFQDAKVSRTALSAASAWRGRYKDDLDSVEVSGGLVAE